MLIKNVIENLEQMFLKWNFDINIRKSGIYFQRQLSKSVSSSPRSLSLICCLIKVEMLPFLAKKSQQSNHKMGNFSCYKKLRRSCILAKLMVSNHKNLFLSISLASKINNCLDPRFTSGCSNSASWFRSNYEWFFHFKNNCSAFVLLDLRFCSTKWQNSAPLIWRPTHNSWFCCLAVFCKHFDIKLKECTSKTEKNLVWENYGEYHLPR